MNRRELITGLICFAAAPAIVRATSIMPVKTMLPTPVRYVVHRCMVKSVSVIIGENGVRREMEMVHVDDDTRSMGMVVQGDDLLTFSLGDIVTTPVFGDIA